MLLPAFILLAALLAIQPATTSPPPPPPLPAPQPPIAIVAPTTGRSPDLLRILDAFAEEYLRENPETASRNGDHRFDAELSDLSPSAVARRLDFAKTQLAALDHLDRSNWTEDDHIDAGIVRFELDRRLQAAAFHPEQLPLTNREGIQITLLQTLESVKTDTPAEKAAWAARLEKVPPLIDQVIAQMRAGIAARRVHPRIVMLGAAEQCAELAQGSATASPFYAPFARLSDQDPLAARAAAAIDRGVNPAFLRLASFLRDEYLPACRETLGESESIDGPASYASKARAFTTTSESPAELHATGLREVARLRAEMLTVIARTGFARPGASGDELLAAFIKDLRESPRFHMKSEQDLIRGYRELGKRVDAELPRLFRTLPRNPYGVRELPKFMQSTAPNGYYYPGTLAAGVPGYFVVNTSRLDQRPTYEMTALFLHEAVPGHHLQLAIQSELEGSHMVRKLADYTVFVEGWALYAEQLGLEMNTSEGTTAERGMYADPYQDFGRLSYEMWRACRLVVDTGLHAQQWPRERAIRYMLDNTALSPFNIEKEVDRYISWPGQALGYMVGLLKIRELRAEAQAKLGERFDVRAFHDVVLGAGAIPLDTLESRIRRWIERELNAGR